MRSRSNLLGRALRHPDVFVASVKHHSTTVLSRPIRTIFAIGFVYVLAVAFVSYGRNPDEVRAVMQSEFTVGELVPLLPPFYILLVLAGAAIIGVPIGLVVTGVRRDLSSSRRRRRRRNG